MKVATFNINNINKRLDNLLAWLERTKPDVVALQELKAEQMLSEPLTTKQFGWESALGMASRFLPEAAPLY